MRWVSGAWWCCTWSGRAGGGDWCSEAQCCARQTGVMANCAVVSWRDRVLDNGETKPALLQVGRQRHHWKCLREKIVVVGVVAWVVGWKIVVAGVIGGIIFVAGFLVRIAIVVGIVVRSDGRFIIRGSFGRVIVGS